MVFSFKYLDRTHDLFTVCDDTENKSLDNCIWLFDMLDGLKEVCRKSFAEISKQPFEMHEVKWKTANVKKPPIIVDSHITEEEPEWHQFRLNKSKGRFVGILIGELFYVVWIDKHHNLHDSEGYGKAKHGKYVENAYELLEQENHMLRDQIQKLERDNQTFQEIFAE